jgi:hypothetical protein
MLRRLAGDRLLVLQNRRSRFDMDPIGISVRFTQCEAHDWLAADNDAPREPWLSPASQEPPGLRRIVN